MSKFFKHTVKPDDDQPIVLITAPTGSAAFQIGGSTIHSAFLLHDNFKSKPSWEKRTQMQLKLEHMMLSITDEISMVGFKQFQSMNETMCTLKGTNDGNWGDICVLAVGDLYQLPPVGQCPIYMSPQKVHTLNDIAPNGWEKMQLHELTQSMRQKDMKFIKCLNNIRTTVPLPGSEEDTMLHSRELKINPNHENYPHDAMHVYAQNVHCDEWNENRLKLLPGKQYTNIAIDSKKDDCTELANVTMPTNPCETGNLCTVLTIKIHARVMITTNIDVADGLTNGAMGTVTNVIIDQTTGKMNVILVAFDSQHVGQETRCTSIYHTLHQNAVPIHLTQATFTIDKKTSFQATRTQFPLTLAWAVTIHKCQGLTLPEIVIDMTPSKGKFRPGEAYVAFSRVRTLETLYIINYTRNQICVSEHVEKEMKRLRKNILPQMPSYLFYDVPQGVKLLHINIGNLNSKIDDIKNDHMFQDANIISLNETHLGHGDILTPHMMGIETDMLTVHCDRNNRGGGVALIVNKNLHPKQISMNTILEIAVVEITQPIHIIVIAVYRPPSTPIDIFLNSMLEIIAEFQHVPTCIVGDFNEDVSMTSNTRCCTMLKSQGFEQMINKPTHDSGTIIDHIYKSQTLHNMQTDVKDCYYSDHDSILCVITM